MKKLDYYVSFATALLIVILAVIFSSGQQIPEEDKNCISQILDKYELSDDMEDLKDIKDLVYMMMMTAKGEPIIFSEINISNRTLNAYIDILECSEINQ